MNELKEKKVLLIAAAVLFLALGLYMDLQQGGGTAQIQRGEAGEDAQEYELLLDAEGVLEGYDYSLTVDAALLKEEQIENYLAEAKDEIDRTFYAEGEDASCVTQAVSMEDTYVDGVVEAEWYLDDYEIVNVDGVIVAEDIDEDGVVVNASVQLTCYEVQQLYQFAFVVYPAEKTASEQLLYDIGKRIQEQLALSGEEYLTLPDEVDGISLEWSIKKENYFLKIAGLELVLLLCIPMVIKEREKESRKKKELQMRLDYPVIVSKLLILNSSGMSLSQVWNRIATSYLDKKEKGQTQMRYAYEEMVLANRQIMDGESENTAWLSFGDRIGLQCYHRFARLLVENRRKGVKGWSSQLEREAEEAFEDRKNLARKLGEEAGTKLLLPMILMFGIVMAIVIMPAIKGYMM